MAENIEREALQEIAKALGLAEEILSNGANILKDENLSEMGHEATEHVKASLGAIRAGIAAVQNVAQPATPPPGAQQTPPVPQPTAPPPQMPQQPPPGTRSPAIVTRERAEEQQRSGEQRVFEFDLHQVDPPDGLSSAQRYQAVLDPSNYRSITQNVKVRYWIHSIDGQEKSDPVEEEVTGFFEAKVNTQALPVQILVEVEGYVCVSPERERFSVHQKLPLRLDGSRNEFKILLLSQELNRKLVEGAPSQQAAQQGAAGPRPPGSVVKTAEEVLAEFDPNQFPEDEPIRWHRGEEVELYTRITSVLAMVKPHLADANAKQRNLYDKDDYRRDETLLDKYREVQRDLMMALAAFKKGPNVTQGELEALDTIMKRDLLQKVQDILRATTKEMEHDEKATAMEKGADKLKLSDLPVKPQRNYTDV